MDTVADINPVIGALTGGDGGGGGGSGGKKKVGKIQHLFNIYMKNIPKLLEATSSATPTVEGNNLKAAQETQPGYQQLNYDLTKQFAPGLAQIGSDIQRQNALEGAETNVQQIKGAGGDAARAATDLARETNPNFYKVMDEASNKAKEALGAINLNGLSPGEAAAVERSLNQTNTATGNLGLINPTNTITNALNFGGAFNSKIDKLNNVINTANQTATTSQNTGVNPVNIALGQPNTSTLSNAGLSTYTPANATTTAPSTSGGLNFGSGVFGGLTGVQNANTGAQAQLDVANSIPAYLGSLPSYS